MYQIQRKGKVVEQLQLLNHAGEVAHTLTVDINIDDIIARWNSCNVALNAAQEAIKSNPTDPSVQQNYGEAVVALLTLVFGEEQAGILLDYYDNHYSEMLLDVFPFLADVIAPAVQKASKDRKEQLEAAAKRTRG